MLCFCESLAPKVTMAPHILFPFAHCVDSTPRMGIYSATYDVEIRKRYTYLL
jgi:hypothetical protein